MSTIVRLAAIAAACAALSACGSTVNGVLPAVGSRAAQSATNVEPGSFAVAHGGWMRARHAGVPAACASAPPDGGVAPCGKAHDGAHDETAFGSAR